MTHTSLRRLPATALALLVALAVAALMFTGLGLAAHDSAGASWSKADTQAGTSWTRAETKNGASWS